MNGIQFGTTISGKSLDDDDDIGDVAERIELEAAATLRMEMSLAAMEEREMQRRQKDDSHSDTTIFGRATFGLAFNVNNDIGDVTERIAREAQATLRMEMSLAAMEEREIRKRLEDAI